MNKNVYRDLLFAIFAVILMIVATIFLCFLTSCTLSMSNISTHGTATDVVDEDMKASPSTTLSIPASLIP